MTKTNKSNFPFVRDRNLTTLLRHLSEAQKQDYLKEMNILLKKMPECCKLDECDRSCEKFRKDFIPSFNKIVNKYTEIEK